MKISKEEVEKVAVLARLALTEGETETFSSEMSSILDYFDKLKEVDTEKVEPTSHASAGRNVMRHDEVRPSLSKEECLMNAPDADKGCLRVPKIIG